MRRLLLILVLAGFAVGVISAGQLEPPGPPAPTMKSLNEIPSTWSQILDFTDGGQDGCNSQRYRVDPLQADAALPPGHPFLGTLAECCGKVSHRSYTGLNK